EQGSGLAVVVVDSSVVVVSSMIAAVEPESPQAPIPKAQATASAVTATYRRRTILMPSPCRSASPRTDLLSTSAAPGGGSRGQDRLGGRFPLGRSRAVGSPSYVRGDPNRRQAVPGRGGPGAPRRAVRRRGRDRA